ncbi:oligopeptidase B [candidate division GN15 bacterium]|uniref:Oligopeptidase B n=1 Tax=candidate division GN15 bacterium TaxID=2072418 RepID=A0A855XBT8_9BACT|nr:MAG: oligopeptidase B [candidate division GN15 bacterium]
MKSFAAFLLPVLLLAAIALQAAELKPPVAKIIPKVDTMFGDIRVDDYYWLRDRENPEVMAYIDAENAYTDSMMKPAEGLQKKLYDEMLGRIKETDLSLPIHEDSFYYYSRTEQGKAYPIFCRKKLRLDAPEQVLLDINALAEGHDYFAVAALSVSPNHRWLLYAYDTAGSERYVIRIKDLTTGQLEPDMIPNTHYSTAWGNDNKTIFYTTANEAWRAYKLWRHTMGTDPSTDVMVYHEPDSMYSVSIDRTRSKKYLMLSLTSEMTSEVRYLDADNPTGQFTIIEPRTKGIEYSVQHRGDKFYIYTNDGVKNFKLATAPVADPGRANWQTMLSGSDSVYLTGFDLFADWLVVYERKGGLQQINVTDLNGNQNHNISFDEPVYSIGSDNNPEFVTDSLRFTYTSLVTPQSIYDYNFKTRQRTLKKQTEVLGGYDPKQYEQERIFAKAPDGAMVPIDMVYRKGLVKDGRNPLWLYAYGAYGISTDPEFRSTRLSLLNRGFIYAIAQVRGGSEMGRQWYEEGKLLNKKNTFTDYIACAEKLIADKYTSSDKLVANGGSAGGLLMGAITNMRPDLFKIVDAEVPFVDLIATETDPSLPLTVEEFEEWGNPFKEEYYKYMRSYSPMDNVEKKAYPIMLIQGGLNDTRVSYWEPTKWAAKLRANNTDNNLLLLKIETAGHGGASGRYGRLKEIALEYAFVLYQFGIKD